MLWSWEVIIDATEGLVRLEGSLFLVVLLDVVEAVRRHL